MRLSRRLVVRPPGNTKKGALDATHCWLQKQGPVGSGTRASYCDYFMTSESQSIFQKLLKDRSIPGNEPEAYKLLQASYETKKLVLQMNQSADPAEIQDLLAKITESEIDGTVNIFTPLHINYGKNLKIGKNVFINFDCVFLDLGGITIEDGVLIAPKVNLLSEGHPVEPAIRSSLLVGPIHIKKNAWVGANATILSGVTVGENSVVAAGAVVTQDVPDNTVVGGIPAKVLRKL
ncbi:hypothetical protein KL927_004640 [Ogataea polymorpha]|nr:hypothetical protein KL927_004640 [Ogataea polymorpha]